MAEWFIEDATGVSHAIDADDWKLTRCYDESGKFRPSDASISVPRRVPVLAKQWIYMEDDGKIRFSGYVSRKPSLTGMTKKEITATGVEALIFNCPCPAITYYGADETSMAQIFSSDMPSEFAHLGLIEAANSEIPYGWLENARPASTLNDDWVAHGPAETEDLATALVKYQNMGLRSRLGTCELHYTGVPFPERASLAELTATLDRGVFRDADDMYVLWRKIGITTPIAAYKTFPLFAHNAFDMRVRGGTIEGDIILNASVACDPSLKVGDLLHGIATAHGLNSRFRYEADKLAYWDVLEDFSDDGIFDIHEADCERIDFKTDSGIQPDALTTLGHGSRLVQQKQSIFTTKPGCAFVRKTVDYENEFYDSDGNLCKLVTAEWDASRELELVELRTSEHNYLPIGADARLLLDGEAARTLQIRKIVSQNGKAAVINLGNRSKDLLDAANAAKDLSNAYLIGSVPEFFKATTWSGTFGIGDLDTSIVWFHSPAFTMPAWASVITFNAYPRALIDVTVSLLDNSGMPSDLVGSFRMYIGGNDPAPVGDLVLEGESACYRPILDSMTGIDVTSHVNWGGNNYIHVGAQVNAYWLEAGVKTVNVSVRLYMVGRRKL